MCSSDLKLIRFTSFILIKNLRLIRAEWERRTNEGYHDPLKNPYPLVIALEEAHKLLNREMASQTAFAAIAREMRKYSVTLLVIDQRPSQIYDEVNMAIAFFSMRFSSSSKALRF